jgi:hypothetical protein
MIVSKMQKFILGLLGSTVQAWFRLSSHSAELFFLRPWLEVVLKMKN